AESELSSGLDLVYTPSEYFGVVFAERALARRAAQVWRAVQESTTWGEFRTAMPAADWEEVVNRLDDDVPPDDTPSPPMMWAGVPTGGTSAHGCLRRRWSGSPRT